jgi:hypothetical protein
LDQLHLENLGEGETTETDLGLHGDNFIITIMTLPSMSS